MAKVFIPARAQIHTFGNSLNIHNPHFSITCSGSVLQYPLPFLRFEKMYFHLSQNLEIIISTKISLPKWFVFTLFYLCKSDVCFQIICLFHLTKKGREEREEDKKITPELAIPS